MANASNVFRDLATELELPLCSTRAKLVALHVLLQSGKDPGPQVMDAVCYLIAEALETAEQMVNAHRLAFEAKERG